MTRVAATAALGLAFTATAIAPANAAESGVHVTQFASGMPDYQSCMNLGASEAAKQNADYWQCFKQSNGKYNGYLYWYT